MILEERKRGFRQGDLGYEVHPSPTARSGKAHGDTKDEYFYGCKQCGFRCLAERVQSPGFTTDGNGGVTISNSEPNVASGFCPFCGSANSRGESLAA